MNILIVGVGGQGSLLASRIMGEFFSAKGLEVSVSEVHGMSQRGGSVVTYVRAGETIASPLITPGEADVVIAFEQLEALRWVHYLKKGGTLAVNTQKIFPMPVITGAMEYPDDIMSRLAQFEVKVISMDALELANQAGNAKATNVVMLGAVSKDIDSSTQAWQDALAKTVPEKFLALNQKAFELGVHG